MNIIQGIPAKDAMKGTAVTLGTFDGVHRGHHRIIDVLQARARTSKAQSVLLTFHPHPRSVLAQDESMPFLLTTIEERLAILQDMEIDHCYVIPFTPEFASTPAEQFSESVLFQALKPLCIVVGEDHTFGRGRTGTAIALQSQAMARGIETVIVEELIEDGQRISSSKVRRLVQAGDMVTAHAMLGRPYQIIAEVVHGDHRGRELGFPTANLHLSDPAKLLPPRGVYAVTLAVDGIIHPGMMNIGIRPTMNDLRDWSIEVHCIDASLDLYNRTVSVHVYQRMRDEARFDRLESLVGQLQKDRITALEILKQHNIPIKDNHE